MHFGIRRRRRSYGERSVTLVVLLLAFCVALTACTDMEPFEPPKPREIPEGPGLFSGKDGEIIIYRR
jgi:hypothetical protein